MEARTKDKKLYAEKINADYDYSCECKMKHGKSSFQKFSMFITETSFYFVRAGGIFSKDIILSYKNNNLQHVHSQPTTMTIKLKYMIDGSDIKIRFLSAEKFNRVVNIINQPPESEYKNDNITSSRYRPPRNAYSDHLVVGPYDRNEAVNEHIKQYNNKAYSGNTKTKLKSVLRDYPKIYKYKDIKSKKVKLVKENENEYDNNAVAVYFRNMKVGYIKKEETESVRNKIDANMQPYAKIFAGPYSEFDEWENKVVEVDNDFKISIDFV